MGFYFSWGPPPFSNLNSLFGVHHEGPELTHQIKNFIVADSKKRERVGLAVDTMDQKPTKEQGTNNQKEDKMKSIATKNVNGRRNRKQTILRKHGEKHHLLNHFLASKCRIRKSSQGEAEGGGCDDWLCAFLTLLLSSFLFLLLIELFELVNNSDDSIVSWYPVTGDSFVVKDVDRFSKVSCHSEVAALTQRAEHPSPFSVSPVAYSHTCPAFSLACHSPSTQLTNTHDVPAGSTTALL